MSISTLLDAPLFTGVFATSELVPSKFDVSIGGRNYMFDRKLLEQLGDGMIASIPAIRTQGDASTEPGEQSLTPDDLWRRTVDSWHHGAGQDYLDREDSLRTRFRKSKGVNVWTQGQISLLNGTTQSLAATGTNLHLMPAGTRLYASDGATLKYTGDLGIWSTTSGTSGTAITALASDGYYVWIADGADIYRTNSSSSSASSWSSQNADRLAYVKGRLMYAYQNTIGYASDIATPTFTSLFSHNNTNWRWVGFAEGPGHIYTAGYVGDKSLVYRIAITREGTSLDAPVVAGELPDGEIIYSIGSYLGFVLLGTSAGARFCDVDGQGNLRIGALIATGTPVRCFEGQNEFVWFGWTNYDGTSGGLGRMSLRTFSDIAALRPAYATDLMVTSTANILSVATFNGLRVFSVSEAGVYQEDSANLVSSGTLDGGSFHWNITDPKIPLYLDVTFASSFAGNVAGYVSYDAASAFTLAGAVSTGGTTSATFPLSQTAVEQLEVRLVLTRDGSTTTAGPTVLRQTARVQPVPSMRRRLTLPVLLRDTVTPKVGGPVKYEVSDELDAIDGWRQTKQVVTVQVGDKSYAAVIEDYRFLALSETPRGSFWNGTALVVLKTV